jgi:hypothetical protein
MMTSLDIVQQRLHNQMITRQIFKKPGDVVQWMGVVQAQDYGAAKWALGLRLQNVTDEDIELAFSEGTILRTHVMRPTWHFVSPADIRWLLALTAPRVLAASGYWYRKLELDDEFFRHSNEILVKALQGGKQLMRTELAVSLQEAGIETEDMQRLVYILMRAELDGVICSGARRGQQFTYALLDERVPPFRVLDREEALAELAKRYFISHGPATLQDFAWWSGLTIMDARAGLEMVKPQLVQERVNEMVYWFAASSLQDVSQETYLLPNYDEYIVGYTDRSAVFDGELHREKLDARGNILFNHTIVMDGRVVGTWKRTLKKAEVLLDATIFAAMGMVEKNKLEGAVKRYGEFVGRGASVGYEFLME